MKKILTTIFLLVSFSSFSQTWVTWNGHLFLKHGNDSTHFGEDNWYLTPAVVEAITTASNAIQSALNLKANLASPAFTGTPTGITSTHVGLGNVTNESKSTMFTSPTFTGSVTIPASSIGMPDFGRVTGSNATTTGQTLVNIAGLTRTLVANAVYEFEANMSASTSAVTTGTSYGVNYSAAGATIEAQIHAAASTTASKAERINAFNTNTTTFLATSAQSGGIRITGIITTGANAGDLTIMHRKLTSGTSTIFINSFIKVTRIQ